MLQLWRPKRDDRFYDRETLDIICDAILDKDLDVLKYYI